jgi:hypothetical protein
MRRFAQVTRAQRWTLECLLQTPYCLRADVRQKLLKRRLVRVNPQRCSEHRTRFVEITEKGRRALGRGIARRG